MITFWCILAYFLPIFFLWVANKHLLEEEDGIKISLFVAVCPIINILAATFVFGGVLLVLVAATLDCLNKFAKTRVIPLWAIWDAKFRQK